MSTHLLKKIIHSESEMLSFGAELAHVLQAGDVVFFEGELGAGKTTLIRGILNGLGFHGFVKSPSYTLVELYAVGKFQVVHVDLYRIESPSAIMHLGLSDYLTKQAILLIEWPKNGGNHLPSSTYQCEINVINHARELTLTTTAEQFSRLSSLK